MRTKISISHFFVVYFISSLLCTLVIWNYLLFQKFQITGVMDIINSLRASFFHPVFKELATNSLFLGVCAATLIALLYKKVAELRPASKGYVRGSDLLKADKLKKLTKNSSVSQVSLADVPIPYKLENLHFLIGGSTGSGKSVAILELLSRLIPRKDRLIVMDPNGEFLSRFYSPGDKILNPFDARSEAWSIYPELSGMYDYERLAKSVIPPGRSAQDKEWHGYAQLLFSETAKELFARGKGNSESLVEYLTKKPLADLKDLLQHSPVSGLFDPGAAKALASTRFIVTHYLAPYQYLKSGNFSLKKWLSEEKNSNLFITWREDMADALRPLISTWLDILCSSILSLNPHSNRRIWIFIDELASLEQLNSLEAALTKGRKHGLRVVAGLQSVAQLDKLYGREQATVLRSCFRNLLILGGTSSDPETAETFSRGLGERDLERKQKSTSRNRQGINRTETIQRVRERLILPSEIMNLSHLEGFLSLAGDYPTAKVKLNIPQLQIRTLGIQENR